MEKSMNLAWIIQSIVFDSIFLFSVKCVAYFNSHQSAYFSLSSLYFRIFTFHTALDTIFISLASILRQVEEAGFTIAMSKEMQLSREQAEEFYEDHKGKDYFDSLINNMTRYVFYRLIT